MKVNIEIYMILYQMSRSVIRTNPCFLLIPAYDLKNTKLRLFSNSE